MVRGKKVAACVLAVLILGTAFAAAATGQSEAGSEASRSGEVRLVSSTAEGVTFELDVPWQQLSVTQVEGGRYVRVLLPGWPVTAQPGAPALPLSSQAIGLPFGATLSLRVEPGRAHAIPLPVPVVPAATQTVDWLSTWQGAGLKPGNPGAMPKLGTALDEDAGIYAGLAAYPGMLSEVASDAVVRQQRVAGIVAYPVQYDPAAQQLTVYESLRVTVSFDTPGAAQATQPGPAAESPQYEQFFRATLLNYETARTWRQVLTPNPSPAGRGETVPWAPPVPGWRVKVRADGLYQLSYAELQAAGLAVDALDPRTFQMFNLGSETAIAVSGESDGHFDPADTILFYGLPVISKYTRDNVYWLTYGQAQGARMAARDGTPGTAETPDHYDAQLVKESNVYYITGMPGDDNLERWVWDYVYAPSRPSWSTTLALPAPYAGTHTATLTVTMLGYLDFPINPDHHAQIWLNGMMVDDLWWDGATWKVSQVDIPQSLLSAGDNSLSVVCPNDTGVGIDIVYVDQVELAYANTLTAEADELAFDYDAAGTWKYRIEGFSAGPVAVYDVTDPHSVVRIEGVGVVPSGAGYAALFQDAVAAPTHYRAGAAVAYRSVQAIEQDTPSDLQSSANGADTIVLTHQAFWNAAGALRDFRAAQGLRAVRVDVQDVYDEFGYGIKGASPIHDFLAFAYAHWQAPAPSFVLLFGDGHYDPKDYYGYGRVNYVPAYLARVDPWIGETAADNRYVTVSGDDTFPDMMLGRLAVNSSAEASVMVAKIIAYEQSPAPGGWNQQVLAVADNADGAGNFAASSDSLLAGYLPQPYQAQKVYYLVTHNTIPAARQAIQAGINAGKLLVNYIGHADQTGWAEERLFTTDDVPVLQNGALLSAVLSMTCLDGYYHYPFPYNQNREALAEVVTRADGRGAVAAWSPTGAGVVAGHENLDTGFFQAVFLDGLSGLGQATTAGKLKVWATGYNLELLDTYLLFGDPALPIALPELTLHINNIAITWTHPVYYRFTTTITVHDQAHAPATGVQVHWKWRSPGGKFLTGTTLTDANGVGTFYIRNKPAGIYQVCVNNLVKAGYMYNSAANEVPNCLSITVP